MNEPASQLRILSALLIVVIALAAGLFFFIPRETQASGQPTPGGDITVDVPPVPHEKVRDAEISLEPSLVYTQTIGGSGDETLVDVYYEDGRMYLFGNTTSSDCDFDAAGAFVAILDERGKTIGFNTYTGELKAVTLFDKGYVMAIERETPVAIAIGYAGDEIKSVNLPTTRAETVLDLKYTDTGYLFVTALTQNISGFSRLKLTMLDRALQVTGSLLTDEVYSLEYIDTLDVLGEYRLVANALSDMRTMLCIGTWGTKLAHYPQEFSYRVLDFWIIDEFRYLAVTDSSTLLIKEDGKYLTLGGKCESGRMAGDKKYMYISTGNSFYCVGNDKVVFSAEYGPTSFYVDSYVYTVSSLNGKIAVRSFLESNKAFESEFNYAMTSPTVFTCPNGLFVIGNTVGKYGGSDVTLLKVDY